MYLIDTVVVSELRKPKRDTRLTSWLDGQRTSDLFISVVTVGEIERGIVRQRARDDDFATALATWLDRVLSLYGERVLPFDLRIARRWGRLSAALGNDSADLMIAATALEHGLTVVTRNVSDFEPTGVETLNPFDARESEALIDFDENGDMAPLQRNASRSPTPQLAQPITSEFRDDILFDRLCRRNVGIAAGEIAPLQLGEPSPVQRRRQLLI